MLSTTAGQDLTRQILSGKPLTDEAKETLAQLRPNQETDKQTAREPQAVRDHEALFKDLDKIESREELIQIARRQEEMLREGKPRDSGLK